MALIRLNNQSLTNVTALPFDAGSNIKEQLVMLCDGGTYTVSSGTYTAANVTAKQDLTTAYADVTGSSISYTPPSGTTAVVYEFIFTFAFFDDHGMGHFAFYIDSDEVTNARQTLSAQNRLNYMANLRYVIPIGGTASTATGRQATWTSAKTLKLQAREYAASNESQIHNSVYWNGNATNTFHKPKLIVTSLS